MGPNIRFGNPEKYDFCPGQEESSRGNDLNINMPMKNGKYLKAIDLCMNGQKNIGKELNLLERKFASTTKKHFLNNHFGSKKQRVPQPERSPFIEEIQDPWRSQFGDIPSNTGRWAAFGKQGCLGSFLWLTVKLGQ